jgi:hypothetical protein
MRIQSRNLQECIYSVENSVQIQMEEVQKTEEIISVTDYTHAEARLYQLHGQDLILTVRFRLPYNVHACALQ